MNDEMNSVKIIVIENLYMDFKFTVKLKIFWLKHQNSNHEDLIIY